MDEFQVDMLETVEFGKLRNNPVDKLDFCDSCYIDNRVSVLVGRCQEEFVKILHLPQVGSKMC